jgi:hypothetical protein
MATRPLRESRWGAGRLTAINLFEVVLVLTTQRRIGDDIAKTVVVRARHEALRVRKSALPDPCLLLLAENRDIEDLQTLSLIFAF